MAQLVVAAAGAAIGSAIPGFGIAALGMSGGSLGWAIGGALGGLLAPGQKSQGPRLGDLSVSTSAYGTPIAYVQGTPRVAGHVVWASDLREIATTTSQGKGGGGSQYTSYTYEGDVLYMLSDNVIGGILRIFLDGKLIYTNRSDATEASITASEGTNLWSRMTVYTGDAAQLPDPTYEAAVGTANAPAYRGRGTVMFEGLQRGSSGRLPNLTFELWIDATPTLPLTRLQTEFAGSSSADVSYYAIGAGTQTGGSVSAAGYDVVLSTTSSQNLTWSSTGLARPVGTPLTIEVFFTCTAPTGRPLGVTRIASVFWADTTYDTGGMDIFAFGEVAGINWFAYQDSINGGYSWNNETDIIDGIEHHFAISMDANGVYSVYLDGTRVVNSRPSVARVPAGSVALGGIGLSTAVNVNYSAVRVRRSQLYTGAYVTPPASFGATDPITYEPIYPAIDAVVAAVCERADMTAAMYDVSDLASITTPVRAMAISQVSSARAVLEMLMQCYYFDAVLSDKIYFRARGAAAVATIAYDDLGATADAGGIDPLPLKIANELEIPAQVALTFPNVDADYQSDTQYSDRLLTGQESTQVVQVPLGFTAAEGKAIADAVLLDQAVAALAATIAVDTRYLRIEATDAVLITGSDGSTYRMRVVRATDAAGVRQLECVLDDASVFTQTGTTAGGTTPQTVVAGLPDSVLELLDIPILRDADDRPGFYAAIKGETADWGSAGLYASLDDVSYDLLSTVSAQAVMGFCTTTLGSWTGGTVWDETNTVTVSVGLGTLASATRDEVLNSQEVNACLIGSELVQFRVATLVETGVYTLSGLLRGRRGTEAAQTTHTVDERFVVLSDAGLRFVPLDSGDLGKLRYYKAASAGQRLSAVSAESITPIGTGLECFSPVDARVDRTAADHVITWKRRTRLSTRLVGPLTISAPLGEASESYEVDIFGSSGAATAGTPVLRTITASAATCTYTSAQRTTDGTGSTVVYMRIYQLSALVGRGSPLITSA